MNYKTLAISAALETGKMLMDNFDKPRKDLVFKSKHDIATFADKKAEKIIVSKINKYYPAHHILSEERGDNNKKSPYFWIIDPLDGTTNYFMHNPLFAVSIALAHKGDIALGVIYVPYMKELYIAEKGKGAELNGKKIKVSGQKNIDRALLAYCHGSTTRAIKRSMAAYNHLKLKSFDMRQIGSAAIELAMTASGRIESIAIPGTNSWDVSAGVLLVREAGGKVTDFKGNDWDMKAKDMLATNGKIHNELLKEYKKI